MKFNNHKCIACYKNSLVEVANLGTQPLANNLLTRRTQKYQSFPLGLNFCNSCTHLQLTYFVNPSILFDNYYYASGTSNSLKSYFSWFASELKKFTLKYNKNALRILEIASNDGSLLDELKNNEFNVTGIDPAKNLCILAHKRHRNIINDFYPSKQINSKFDFIIAQNVFAHNPDPRSFLESILNDLTCDGIALIQTSQALMFEENQFDTIYHEHYSFFSYTSMKKLVNSVGGFINSVYLLDIHGGSFLFIITKNNIPKLNIFNDGKYKIKSINNCKRALISNKLDFFQKKMNKLISKLHSDLVKYQKFGFKIVFVGAAAKAIVILNLIKNTFDEFPIDIVVDEAKLKINKFIPNINLQIKELNYISSVPEKKLFVISAWNFRLELKNKIIKIVGKSDDRLLTYFPSYINESLN